MYCVFYVLYMYICIYNMYMYICTYNMYMYICTYNMYMYIYITCILCIYIYTIWCTITVHVLTKFRCYRCITGLNPVKKGTLEKSGRIRFLPCLSAADHECIPGSYLKILCIVLAGILYGERRSACDRHGKTNDRKMKYWQMILDSKIMRLKDKWMDDYKDHHVHLDLRKCS